MRGSTCTTHLEHVLPIVLSIPKIKLNAIDCIFELPKIRIQRSTCTTIHLALSASKVKIALKTKGILGVLRILAQDQNSEEYMYYPGSI